METKHFNYKNKETKVHPEGQKIVRHVSIKNGKGYKSVTKYHKGKKIGFVKKPIHPSHILTIKKGIFIPGLFIDCQCDKRRTRKNRK
jgi:hypothetical protein